HGRDLDYVRRPAAIQIGDVGRGAAAYRGGDLLQRVVVVYIQCRDVDLRMAAVELADQPFERRSFCVGVALPDGDARFTATAAATTAATTARRRAGAPTGGDGDHGSGGRGHRHEPRAPHLETSSP